jgi:ubiquinone/menaquinone biosynthesis C-methylase UbiE
MKKSLRKVIKFCIALIGAVLVFPAICANATSEKSTGSVEHKNLQLDLYLDFIRYNCHEKIGILPYILQNPDGVYLEIGTGGDPIAEILNKIPKTSRTTLIASDIEKGVLNALPQRHPELKKYINSTEGPVLKLQKLNAVDMSIFENNSLSGINASAILHEIISYAGGFEGVEKFFKEAFRTLRVGGVLAYRDPEGVSDKNAIVAVNLKNKSIKLFTHIFIYKFLSKEGSNLAKAGIKMKIPRSKRSRYPKPCLEGITLR